MIKYLKDLKKEEPKDILVELMGDGYVNHSSVCRGYDEVFSQLRWHMSKEDNIIIKEIYDSRIVLSTSESDIESNNSKDVEKLEAVMKKSLGQIEDFVRGKAIKTTVYAIQDSNNKVHGLYNEEVKAQLIKNSLEIEGYENLMISPIMVE